MGDVYLAQVHPRYVARSAAFKLPRQVVLKASKLEFHLQDRLRKEVQLLQRCDHPNIVRILPDPRSNPEKPFYTAAYAINGTQRYQYAMEYVGQSSAQQLLEQQGRLSVADTIQIGIHITKALEHIHAQQILNLDIKPSNIVLRPHKLWSCLRGQAQPAVLCDFGTARFLTDRAHSYGTEGFASPEQSVERSGQPSRLDPRSDIFSLGATLYTLLAGAPPHKNSAEYFAQAPAPLQQHNPSVSAQLSAVIGKAIAVDPNHRYQSAREFRQALEGEVSFWPLQRCQRRILAAVFSLALILAALTQPTLRGYLDTLIASTGTTPVRTGTPLPSPIATLPVHITEESTNNPTIIVTLPSPPTTTGGTTADSGVLNPTSTRVPTRLPTLPPTITPTTSRLPTVTLSPAPPSAGPITVIDPKPGAAINGNAIVRWRWPGILTTNQSFEILVWHTLDANHTGAVDANVTTPDRTRVGNGEYAYQFDFHTAKSVQSHGEGEYLLAVALVEINPYKRIGMASAPVSIRVTN